MYAVFKEAFLMPQGTVATRIEMLDPSVVITLHSFRLFQSIKMNNSV